MTYATPSDHSRAIRFYHRGEIVSVSGVQTTRSVLDWLREDAHCTGTGAEKPSVKGNNGVQCARAFSRWHDNVALNGGRTT